MSYSERYRFLWLGAVVLLLVSSPRAEARYTPQSCKNSFTVEQEIAEGRKVEAEVFKSMPVLPDSSSVSVYIRDLGGKLAAFAPGQKWPYSFHVVNQADINAFALPGGPIFVNLGTIQAAENESQLAGVVAHEISHVVLRHATCNITKQEKQKPLWVLGQIAAGIALPGAVAGAAQQGIGTAAQLGFLKMSRDAEKQADLLGTDILYDAGFDPRGMAQFFEVIQSRYGQGGAQFLSNHPNPGNRTAYVNDEIASLPPRTHPVKNSAAFLAVKREVAGMHAYTAQQIASGEWRKQTPKQTVAAASNTPSESWIPVGNWQTFRQPQFTIGYPGNWRAYEQSGSVTIAPPGGLEQTPDGKVALVYGLVVDAYRPPGGASLEQAIEQLVDKLKAENPQMRVKAGVRELSVNGRPARDLETINSSGSSANASGEGSDEHDWIVGIQQPDGQLRYVVFVSPAANFEELRPTFEQILRTIQIQA